VNVTLYILIAVFGLASYTVGIVKMLKNQYVPSTFSRIIWVLLAVNSFAGVILSEGSQASILLGSILLLGNIGMCIVSFWKGTKHIGKLEYICLSLLIVSGIIWIFFSAPLLNLVVSLVAHLIGGFPTFKKVWIDPKSEDTTFWSLFFIASVLSVVASPDKSLNIIILPLYFALFDGALFALTLRQNKRPTEAGL